MQDAVERIQKPWVGVQTRWPLRVLPMSRAHISGILSNPFMLQMSRLRLRESVVMLKVTQRVSGTQRTRPRIPYSLSWIPLLRNFLGGSRSSLCPYTWCPDTPCFLIPAAAWAQLMDESLLDCLWLQLHRWTLSVD